MARGELHMQLSLNYASDEKLESVSRGARLLYIDAVCHAKRELSDGFVSDVQVVKLAFPESAARAKRQAAELCGSGAFERIDALKGYVITGYLKRNPSRAQVLAGKAEAAEAGVRGNHERWHKDRISPHCPLCPGVEPDGPDGIGFASGDPTDPRSGFDRVAIGLASPETETETKTRTPQPPASGGRRCTKHGRPRRGCQDCTLPANPTVIGPPCGSCSPARRLEDPDGSDLGPCPNCHPSRQSA